MLQRPASPPVPSPPSDRQPASSLRFGWWGALALLTLAVAAGVFFRFGLAYGTTLGFELANVRHAHSHLMYFGWTTPALFALIFSQVARRYGRPWPRGARPALWACLGAALLSFPLFWLFGYVPAELGGRRLPLAVMSAGLNMLVWYALVAVYARQTRGLRRHLPLLCWDAALTFLVLASIGAWGLALLKPLRLDDPVWISALTHLFLDYFSEGWLVLGVLGLAVAALEAPPRPVRRALAAVVVGIPFTFALGMPPDLVPPALRLVAGGGGLLTGAGLLALALLLAARRSAGAPGWTLPLGLLGLKALGQAVVSVAPGLAWASAPGLRVLYLHLMLLGFVTLALMAAAEGTWGRSAVRGRPLFYVAVAAVLASLVPLTPLWPMPWPGAYRLAAWVSVLPLGVLLGLLARARAA